MEIKQPKFTRVGVGKRNANFECHARKGQFSTTRIRESEEKF